MDSLVYLHCYIFQNTPQYFERCLAVSIEAQPHALEEQWKLFCALMCAHVKWPNDVRSVGSLHNFLGYICRVNFAYAIYFLSKSIFFR